MSKKLELVGSRFGRLVVGGRADSNLRGRTVWLTECDCGNSPHISGENLVRGKTRSCGCLSKESSRTNGKKCMHKDRSVAAIRNLYAICRYGAKVRSLEFEITENEYRSFLFDPCFYCGLLPSNRHNDRSGNIVFLYSGIDRVDNRIGYIIGNLVSCCSMCNKGKGVNSASDFLEWVSRVQVHQDRTHG